MDVCGDQNLQRLAQQVWRQRNNRTTIVQAGDFLEFEPKLSV
jgi:hypothetical protein